MFNYMDVEWHGGACAEEKHSNLCDAGTEELSLTIKVTVTVKVPFFSVYETGCLPSFPKKNVIMHLSLN